MEGKLDRRTAYTRKVIKESLYELLKTKHLKEITVKELCALADINRATFYRNYVDIYDLYEKLEQELTSSAFASGDIFEDRSTLLKLIYENKEFYKEFFESRLESSYIREQMEKLYDRMKDMMKTAGSFDEENFRISYQYNYYGFIGVVGEWLKADCPTSPEDFGKVLYALIEKQYQ